MCRQLPAGNPMIGPRVRPSYRGKSLDDPSEFRPQWIFRSDAQPWDQLDRAIPKYELIRRRQGMRKDLDNHGTQQFSL